MSWRRHARWLLAAAPLAALTLTACSGSGARLGLPVAATAEAPNVGNLWLGAWIASFVIGGLVWGLIGWAVIRYRRKDSVGSIVRSFPKGRRHKPPNIRARCYSPPASVYAIFVI